MKGVRYVALLCSAPTTKYFHLRCILVIRKYHWACHVMFVFILRKDARMKGVSALASIILSAPSNDGFDKMLFSEIDSAMSN